ncbi:MAG: hypothetical protein VYE76_05110 [Pseudomonadota bacterium]|nr:hypothetical protein [Pseudomonadota bacterium]
MFRRLLVGATLSALACASLAAGNVYRFNVDGQVVIKDSVPADLAPLGYDVLNSRGMLVKRVPRELTPEEIAERDRLKAEQEARNVRIERRKQKDKDLMRIYSTVADVDRALQRKSDEVITQKDLQARRITDLTEKLEQAQQAAANTERRGAAVPESLVDEIRHYQSAIQGAEVAIRELEEKLETLNHDYGVIRQRLRVLSVYPEGTLPEDVDNSRLPALNP